MTPKIFRKFILIIFIFLLPFQCLSADEYFVNDKIILNDSTKKIDGIHIVIEKKEIKSEILYRDVLFWGGDEREIPKSVVASIKILIGKVKIYLPFSSYADLGNPKSASLIQVKNGFKIKIEGGDAAGAYNATIYIRNGNISNRKVISSEFPDQVWEETNYSFIPRNSNM